MVCLCSSPEGLLEDRGNLEVMFLSKARDTTMNPFLWLASKAQPFQLLAFLSADCERRGHSQQPSNLLTSKEIAGIADLLKPVVQGLPGAWCSAVKEKKWTELTQKSRIAFDKSCLRKINCSKRLSWDQRIYPAESNSRRLFLQLN